MLQRGVRVAVVGHGTAGPAAALNIVRRLGEEWNVTIFGEQYLRKERGVCQMIVTPLTSWFALTDKAENPRAVGAGIGIQPIGLTALKNLGLLEVTPK